MGKGSSKCKDGKPSKYSEQLEEQKQDTRKDVFNRLHNACMSGDVGSMEELIELQKQYRYYNSEEWTTLLHTAYKQKQKAVAQLIIRSDLVWKETLLHGACKYGDLDDVKEVFEKYNPSDFRSLSYYANDALKSNHHEIVGYFRSNFKDSFDIQDKLQFSCFFGEEDVIKNALLNEHNPDIDWRMLNNKSYHFKQMNIVRIIRSSGKLTLQDQLWDACWFGDKSFILKHLFEIDEQKVVNWRWLMDTAYYAGNTDIGGTIHSSNKIEELDKLWYACMYGNIKYVESCVDSIHQHVNIEWSCLMKIAYKKGHVDIARCIIEKKAITPKEIISSACKYGDVQMLAHYMDRMESADIDWIDLIETGHRESVIYLGGRKCASLYEQMFSAFVRGDINMILDFLHSPDIEKKVNLRRLFTAAFPKSGTTITKDKSPFQTKNDFDLRPPLDKKLQEAMQKMHHDICDEVYFHMKQCLDEATQAAISRNRRSRDNQESSGKDYNTMLTNLIQAEAPSEILAMYLKPFAKRHWFKTSGVCHCVADEVQHGMDLCQWWTFKQKSGMKANASGALLTPLHIACYYLDINVIEFLVRRTSDTNTPGFMGQTPLHVLCQGRTDDMDKLIIKEQVDGFFSSTRMQDTHKMLKDTTQPWQNRTREREEACELLQANGADANVQDFNQRTPLHLACCFGDKYLVRKLIYRVSNIDQIDSFGMSAMSFAASHGHSHLLEDVFKYRECNVNHLNMFGQSPIYLACTGNHIGVAKQLIEMKADINLADCNGITPLMVAVESDYSNIAILLIENKADINCKDHDGQTALHKAANMANTKMGELLLGAGITINAKDVTGCTALHITSMTSFQFASMLLANHCKVDEGNYLGNTALALSSMSNQVETSRLLLAHDANINHRNNCGESALHAAVSKLDMAMAMFLIENQADATLVDNLGRGLIHAVITSDMHQSKFRKSFSANKEHAKNVAEGIIQIEFDENEKFLALGTSLQKHDLLTSDKRVIALCFSTSLIQSLLSLGLDINVQDFNGQSPLHLAAQSESICAIHFLLQQKADLLVRDSFGDLPLMLAVTDARLFSHMWPRCKEFLSERDKDRIAHLCHWLGINKGMIRCPEIGHIIKKYQTMPQQAQAIDLKDKSEDLQRFIRSDSDEFCKEFIETWLTSLQPLTYVDHQTIVKTLAVFAQDIAQKVAVVDPFVAFEYELSGSEKEKTKVMATDELDAVCHLKNIKFYMFEPPAKAAHLILKAFTELRCKAKYVDHLRRVLDDDLKLSYDKLFFHFSKAIAQVLSEPRFMQKYPNLQRVTMKDVTAGNRSITALRLKWCDDVYPLLDVSVDLVPGILTPGWMPPWANTHKVLEKAKCILVPKWKAAAPESFTLIQVGIHQWGVMFDEMPDEMRQGYRMAKVTRDKSVCPQLENWPEVYADDFITSYLLKQCIVKLYANMKDGTIDGRGLEDVDWARRVYDMMIEAFTHQRLECLFIPEYNLIYDEKYVQFRDTAIGYAKLCRKLLTDEAAAHFRRAYMGV